MNNLYQNAGVDTEKADKLADWLAEEHQNSQKNQRHSKGKILSGIGGFASLYAPALKNYSDPVLVSSTDGVGTKLLLALSHSNLSGIGQDLVAMCVNDLYTTGAEPHFFLDYYACSVLNEQDFKTVLSSIKDALRQCDCLLLGGETAELPGIYRNNDFDLAGFVVGIVDRQQMVQPNLAKETDVLIALPSTGFHSNGYSLIRKMLSDNPKLSNDHELTNNLLRPTKIYHEVPSLLKKFGTSVIHGIAHITGGGVSGNLPRVLPQGLNAVIDRRLLKVPSWMSSFLNLNDQNFFQFEPVFNLGSGMILVVDALHEDSFLKSSEEVGLNPFVIGRLQKATGASEVVYV